MTRETRAGADRAELLFTTARGTITFICHNLAHDDVSVKLGKKRFKLTIFTYASQVQN